jgi:hypothetical protein
VRTAPTTIAIALFALLTGCSGGSDDTAADSAGADAGQDAPAGADDGLPESDDDSYLAHASLARDLQLPMDAYRISDEDQQILQEARNVLVVECMRRYGFEHQPAEPREEPSLAPYVYLYGVDDPGLAAEHGYLHPIDLDPRTYAPVPEADLSAEEEIALYGDQELDGRDIPATLEAAQKMTGPELNGEHVPITGCAGEATLTINRPGDDWVDPTFIFQLENDASTHADDDPRVVAITDDWAACMAEAGYEAEGPVTARDDLGLAGDVSGEEAIAAAVRDVACKTETDLVARWSVVDAEYQREEIAEYADILRDYEEQHRERMAAARAVLS